MATPKPRKSDAGSADNGNASIQLIPNEVGELTGFTPNPEGPLPRPGLPERLPKPEFPFPVFCGPVSGRYQYSPPAPGSPGPVVPINLLRMTVRVDVDRFYPQQRISIEVSRLFPSSQAHAIAEVTSDSCTAYNRRRITANITYRDGDASLIPGTSVTFTASRFWLWFIPAHSFRRRDDAKEL